MSSPKDDLSDGSSDKESYSDDFDDEQENYDLDSIPSWIDDEDLVGINEPEAREKLSDGEGNEENIPLDISRVTTNNTDDSLVAEIEQQRDSYVEALRQLQADFENYKKRVQRDQEEEALAKSDQLIEDLIPVLDNFRHAFEAIYSDDETSEIVRKGIELVHSELMGILERQGLEVIDNQGEPFDPEVHDAVQHEDTGEHDQEMVVEVLRPGYKVRERVIRPAMVRVAR